MANKFIVQHRRGSTTQWQASDVVLRDGEIAIEDVGGGRRGLLIGDGNHTYAELPKIYLREVVTKTVSLNLPAENWIGEQSPYSQVVTVAGVTYYSKVDLQPTAEIIAMLMNDEISLTTKNENGVITVYAIGNKPTVDISIQATVTEVWA